MGNQPPALEKLFDEWAKKHEENLSTGAPYFMPHEAPYGGFVRDGIVNLDLWKKQKIRICFVLDEASGYADRERYPNGHDLAAEWNEKGSFSKFMFKIAVWTKAVNDAFVPVSTYSKKEVLAIKDDLIRSIAVVNMKKSDGQKLHNADQLRNFARVDAAELRRELEIINANVILFCNDYYFMCGKRPDPEAEAKAVPAEAAEAPVETPAETVEAAPPEIVEALEEEAAETVEAAEGETKPKSKSKFKNREPKIIDNRPCAFNFDEFKNLAKFAYTWNNKVLLRLWTPANFIGTLKSNTINYYAVREVCRAAFKAFSTNSAKKK